MAFVRHLQVTLESATFKDPLSSSLDERMVYVKASHKNIVYTTNMVEGVGNVELHHLWGNDGTNVFHFAYEDNSEDIILELFNRDHICIGISRLHLAGLAKVMPEQDPELKTLPVSSLGRRWSYGSLALTAQIKRQQTMGKLGNLNVVLQEGIIDSISSRLGFISPAATEPRVFAKLSYKHTTHTVGTLRGETNKFVWHEHFTFRINSWDPVDVLEICIYYGAFQVGECKVLLSLFINLEEDLQADRKDFFIRTEDLLVDKRSVGSVKVAGSFSTLHKLDVLRTQNADPKSMLKMQHLMSTDSESGITSASANSPNSQVRRVWKVIGTVLICICKFKEVLSRYRKVSLAIEGMTAKELLLTFATAIELKDVSTIKQSVSALRNISSVNGEPRDRVTAYFLQALQRRCVSLLGPKFLSGADLPSSREEQEPACRWMLDVLTNLVDLSPYVRFGQVAANGAMLKAFEGMGRIHIVDFSTTHGMQWRFFIDALADRVGGPPNFRLTLCGPSLPIVSHPTYEEIGHRLTKYARLRNVPLEFNVMAPPLERLSSSDFDVRDGEALGVNFSLGLHYLADESAGLPDYPPPLETQLQPRCPRDNLLHLIRSLNPTIVTLYEEDCDATSTDVMKRVQQSYEHEWIPFDFMATLLPSGSKERQEYEKIVGMKIENILAWEGERRIERLESKRQWMQRMRRLGFLSLPLGYDVASALRDILDHSWGMKNEVDECTQSLLWKGHSLGFASAWAPHFSNPAACPLDSGEHRQQQEECQKPSPAALGSFPFDVTPPTLDDAQGTVEVDAVLKELCEEKNETGELARLTREFLLSLNSTHGSKAKEKMLEMNCKNVEFMKEEDLEATTYTEWFQLALQESLQEFLGESWAQHVPNEIEKWFSRDHLRPLKEYLQPFQSELLLRPSVLLEQQSLKAPNDSETPLSSVRIGKLRDSDPAVIKPSEEFLAGFSTDQPVGKVRRKARALHGAALGDTSDGGGAHGTALEQHCQQSIDVGYKMSRRPEREALARVDMAESKRQPRYSIETRSKVDLLDDGFKWRKYGQKGVKNSAHPRYYYRCTTANCPVRKRVERTAEDPSLVRTTYDGTHSHQCTNLHAAANTGNIADSLLPLLGIPQVPADTNAMQSLVTEVGPRHLQTFDGPLLHSGSQVPPQKTRWGRDTLLTLLKAHQLFRLHYGTQHTPDRPGTVRGADGVEEISTRAQGLEIS